MEFLKEIFNQVYDVKGLIMWAGYIGLVAIVFSETGLLVGFFLPGDSLLVTAGLFAATGNLNILFLNLLLIPAAILGNIAGYWIGHKSGPYLFKKEQSLFFRKDYLIKTRIFYEKHGASTLIITRFMPILRTFAPIVAGIGGMDYKKFMMYNTVGAIAWVLSLTLVGFYLGRLIPGIEKHIDIVIIIVVVLSMLPGIIKFIKHRLQKRKISPDTP
jgi:membrane-associated protein